MKKVANGRKPTIVLTANGQTKPIKEWAQVINPLDPKKGEFIIRDRYQHRKRGKKVTDAQIIYGFTYMDAEEMPLEMGLPRLCQMWFVEAMNLAMPIVEEHVSNRMAAHLAKKTREIYREAGKESPAQSEFTPITSAQMEPVPASTKAVNPVPGTPPADPQRVAVEAWMERNGIDNPLAGDRYRSESIVLMMAGEEPTDEMCEAFWGLWQTGEDEYIEAVKAASNPNPDRPKSGQAMQWWRQHLETRYIVNHCQNVEPKPFEIADDPRLSDDEELALEAPVYAQELCQSSRAYTDEVVIGRFLKSGSEYNCLAANPQIIDSLLGSNARQDGFAKFIRFALYDIGFRCALQIFDFRTFNRAQQIYMLSVLCRKYSPSWLGRNPDLVDSLMEEVEGRWLNPNALARLHQHPTLCWDFYRNDRKKVDESLRTLYDHAEKAGKGVGQPNGSWAAREESGGQVTVSLSPLFLPEDHNFNLTEALFYATNYGRNMAMWPKVVAVDGSESDFKVERPDLVPCELYYDGLKGRDYTVFRDAPLLEDGTYMFVNLNDEDE